MLPAATPRPGRRPLLADPVLDEEFDRRGYVVLPLLGTAEIEALKDLFSATHGPHPPRGFVSTAFDTRRSVKASVRQRIASITKERLDEVLTDYRTIDGTFLFKHGPESRLGPHQDWTIVDESRYDSANVWMPLCDVGPDEGPLFVVPGTHRGLPALRSPTIPSPFRNHDEALLAHGVPLHVPAGTSVILNHALIHYSAPNLTSRVRVAAVAGIASRGAPLLFYFWDSARTGVVEVFEMADGFFSEFDDLARELHRRPASGRSLGFVPHETIRFDRAEVDAILERASRSAAGPVRDHASIEPSAPAGRA